MRLVELIDQLLERMARDERLRFTLDGQAATVDDYLEVRPEAEPLIRRLIAEGRLAIGPWQILLDEFLVSGETIVRNLELGWARAEELGRAMPVGYLPDMFGHVAQMPQILRRAGIDRAVVWRGVPEAIDEPRLRLDGAGRIDRRGAPISSVGTATGPTSSTSRTGCPPSSRTTARLTGTCTASARSLRCMAPTMPSPRLGWLT